MDTTVEHVHHRHREDPGLRAAEVAVEREADLRCGSTSGGEGDGEDGVGPQCSLVGSPVEEQHRPVDRFLVGGVHPDDLGSDLVGDVRDGLGDALAAPCVATVAQLDCLERASGGTTRHPGTAEPTAGEVHLGFDGRIPPGVEDLTGLDCGDRGGAHDVSCAVVRTSAMLGTARADPTSAGYGETPTISG